MITYQDLYHLQLGGLDTAVEQFDATIRQLKGLDEKWDEGVKRPFTDAEWVGSWMGVQVIARKTIDMLGEELTDAVTEAEAIRDVLRQARQELQRHKTELHRLAHEEAPARNLRVSDTGQVTLTRDPTTYEPEGDVENVMSRARAEVLELERRIHQVLTAATEADEVAAVALRRSAGKADEQGFNDRTVSMDDVVDEREARQAAELLRKVDGDLSALTPTELAQVERLMSGNQHSTAFNRTLLDSLGPEATLALAESVGDLRQAGDPNGTYATIERSLANGIGAASQDPAFFDRWRRDMRRLGTEHVPETGKLGYQVLAGLLERGGGYPPHMLADLTDDMIEAERDHPDLWDREYPHLADKPNVDDPLDRMLGIMGRHPEAAGQYFDVSTDEGQRRLDYFLEERDWPTANRLSARDSVVIGEYDPPNSRVGLGDALEAAVRGERADTPPNLTAHTPRQQQLMDSLIDHFGGDSVEGNPVHPNLREPLGDALADYTASNHRILTGDYASEHQNPHQLIRFMRGVAEDPEAYATMHEAESLYIADRIAGADSDHVATEVREGGEVLGVYDEIRADVLEDEADASGWNDDVLKHIVSEPVGHVPGVGSAATAIIDVWMNDMAERVQTEAASQVAREALASEVHITDLVESWATHEGLHPDTADMRDLKHEGQAARFDGKERAAEALGR